MVHLENGGVKAIADGISRVRLIRQIQTEPYFMGEVEFIEEQSEPQELLDTLIRSVAALFKITLSLGRPMSDHWAAMIERADDPGKLADLICVYLPLKAEVKQGLLEIEDPLLRLKKAFLYLQTDVQANYPKLQTAGESGFGARSRQKDKKNSICDSKCGPYSASLVPVMGLRFAKCKSSKKKSVIRACRMML